MYRVMYLGQKQVGEKCYEALKKIEGKSLSINAVVTNDNDKVWWKSNTIFLDSQKRQIPFISNEKRNNKVIEELIISQKINLIMSVQHPWILPAEVLSKVKYQAFNLHNAKLPEYQGYNSCNHAIMNGDKFYTSTLHWLADNVDEGDIAFEETFEISSTQTALGLYQKAAEAGYSAFLKLVDFLLRGYTIPRKLVQGIKQFYPRSSLNDIRQIKNVNDPQELDRKSRAMYFPPFEPAYILDSSGKHYVLPPDFLKNF
jgi:methionyl-tRNA formyltransferase